MVRDEGILLTKGHRVAISYSQWLEVMTIILKEFWTEDKKFLW